MTKVEQFSQSLRERILKVSPGARLPSVRELAKASNVSHLTVVRAMDMLEDEGYLTRHSTIGTFASRPGERASLSQRKRRVMLAVPDYPSAITDLLVSRMQTVIASQMNVPLVVRYNYAEPIDRVKFREKFDAMIMMMSASPFEVEQLYQLKKMNVPVVVLGQLLTGVSFDCVECNQDMTGSLAADHLIKLGHRRLAVMISEPHVPNINAKANGFVHQAELAGIRDVQILDCRTQSGESSPHRAHETLRAELRRIDYPSRRLDFTGLFVVSGGSALGVLKACYDAGVAVPKELSVVAGDNYPGSELYCPALTVIDPNFDRLAEEAVAIVNQRLEGNRFGCLQKLIPPSLVVRESTGRASSV